MRKAVVVVLIAALTLSMLALLAGCGGDANKDEAKKLMTSGDAYMDSVKEQTTALEEEQANLASSALSGDMSAVTGDAGVALQAAVAKILDGIESDLNAAKGEYEQILKLDGVQDYKDYAAKMIEAIDVYLKQLGYTSALVAKLGEALNAMAQGQDIDIITLMMESEELQQVDELGKQGDALVKEADQIKLDKKLES